jgi:L-amino acid N-acyltransferase YncA
MEERMNSKFTIIDATLIDLERIVEIYNSTIAGRIVTADLEPVSVNSKKKWFEDHSPDFRPLWIMKHDEKIIAWFSFQSFYGRPAYDSTAEISIYVSEEYRSKGIGSIFLDKAIEKSLDLRINTLLGFVFSHNEPSLKLLKKHGFEEWGYLPKIAVLDNVERDLVIFGIRVQNRE